MRILVHMRIRAHNYYNIKNLVYYNYTAVVEMAASQLLPALLAAIVARILEGRHAPSLATKKP